MTRRDWLLLFAAYEGAPDGLDPIRTQKGMFLFSMKAAVPDSDKYRFKPYDYGPMSPAVYSDLDSLVIDGYLEKEPQPGKSWSKYRPTTKAVAAAHRLAGQAVDEGHLSAAVLLYEIKSSVASLNFNDLLVKVYDEYPDYAVKSVFRRK